MFDFTQGTTLPPNPGFGRGLVGIKFAMAGSFPKMRSPGRTTRMGITQPWRDSPIAARDESKIVDSSS
jgi:hypothetical protein